MDFGIIATGMLPGYTHRDRPVAEGAEPVARLADPGSKVFKGGHYDGCLPGKAATGTVDPDGARKLWPLIECLTLLPQRQL